jgi:hypothetical protein
MRKVKRIPLLWLDLYITHWEFTDTVGHYVIHAKEEGGKYDQPFYLTKTDREALGVAVALSKEFPQMIVRLRWCKDWTDMIGSVDVITLKAGKEYKE